tara:strand:- start:771 stop:1709 length:939 start_codon:yes stop_codon:yes gene_type:complete
MNSYIKLLSSIFFILFLFSCTNFKNNSKQEKKPLDNETLTDNEINYKKHWPDYVLKEKFVEIEDNNYLIEEHMLVKSDLDNTQISYFATAPTNSMSDDMFNSICSTLITYSFIEMGLASEDVEITELDDVIGKADIEIKYNMTKDGLQIEFVSKDGNEKTTMTWDEALDKQQNPTPVQSRLNDNFIKTINNEFFVEDHILIKMEEEELFQVSLSATAPTEIMNKDFFNHFYTSFSTVALVELGLISEEFEITELNDVIGKADIEIKYIMTKDGLQVEFISAVGLEEPVNEKTTMTWKELFNDEYEKYLLENK